MRFADLVEERGLRIPFKSLHRADLLLRGDTVAALGRAGASMVWMGAESGSQQVLDAMDKGTRVQQIREATRRLHARASGSASSSSLVTPARVGRTSSRLCR